MRNFLLCLSLFSPVYGFTIKVDYRFDTEGFFDASGSRDAIEAAAARWSRIIDQELLAVDIQDELMTDTRFGLIHPGTGERIELSAAASAETDVIVEMTDLGPADIYLDGFTLEEDVWILFVGGRGMGESALGSGGPIGLGLNPLGFVDDPTNLVNRGFNLGADSLNVLGGTVSFNLNTNWNFSLFEQEPGGEIDFYSVALHEIAHGLGMSSRSGPEWVSLSSSGRYRGAFAIEAFNADNQERETALDIVSLNRRNFHWRNNTYESRVFPLGVPNTNGGVRDGALQDLLMDPAFSFTAEVRRFEVTNVEVGGLRDIGWSVITEDPPAEPEPTFAFERSATGAVRLTIASEEGSIYRIQTSTNTTNWLNVRPFLIGDGTDLIWEDGQEGFTDPYGSAADLAGKFYRVIEN